MYVYMYMMYIYIYIYILPNIEKYQLIIYYSEFHAHEIIS